MEDITKTCYKCKTSKPLLEFNKSKHGTFGVHGHCRQCQREVRKLFYDSKEKPTKYWLTDTERSRRKNIANHKYHTDPTWKENHLTLNRNRRRLEPAKIKARTQRKKWYAIPENKIACAFRVRLRKAIKDGIKMGKTEQLLGCSFEEAKQYLESKFVPNMTWDNYGKEWHIDHIIPCDFFNLNDPEHQQLCFNYKNLQPLWKDKNLSKGSKITIDNVGQFLNGLRRGI